MENNKIKNSPKLDEAEVNQKLSEKNLAFDTKKFELEKDLKKISLSKHEYKKWFKEQTCVQDQKCELQKRKAKRASLFIGIGLFAIIFIVTITIVATLKG